MVKKFMVLPAGFLTVGFALAVVVGACSIDKAASGSLPEGTDNVPTGHNWERIAAVPNVRGVYAVVDTENGVICYYVISDGAYNRGPNGISCLREREIPIVE